MTPEPCWILCASDDKVAHALSVALASLIEHCSYETELHIVIVDNGISPDKRRRLERVLQRSSRPPFVVWKTADKSFLLGLKPLLYITITTYLRLYIEDLLPPNVHRICYIDCDTLFSGDIAELNGLDLQGKTLGAVQDYNIANWKHPHTSIGRSYLPTLDAQEAGNFDLDTPYFNAGVLVVDLNRWREKGIKEKALKYARQLGSEGLGDQDAMNWAVGGDWCALPLEWNVQGAIFFLEILEDTPLKAQLLPLRASLLRDAKIMHFAGPLKPWDSCSRQSYVPLWRQTLLRSGWFPPHKAALWRLGLAIGIARDRFIGAIGRRPFLERTH